MSVELYQTGIFEGGSIDLATAPQQHIMFFNDTATTTNIFQCLVRLVFATKVHEMSNECHRCSNDDPNFAQFFFSFFFKGGVSISWTSNCFNEISSYDKFSGHSCRSRTSFIPTQWMTMLPHCCCR